MLSVLKLNKVHEYPQNIFEVGGCFRIDASQETGVNEFFRLSVALCGTDSNYTKIKQVFQCLLVGLGAECSFEPVEHPSFIPGRVARVLLNGKGIAYIGELSPEVLSNWDLQMPVAAFELNLSDMFELLKRV